MPSPHPASFCNTSASPQMLHSISNIFRYSPVDCYFPKQPHCNYQLHPTPHNQPYLDRWPCLAWLSQAMRAAINSLREDGSCLLILRKLWYKMYDSLHKNHMLNKHQCLLIGYKYMNLLLRRLCAHPLEGKNQSERQPVDKAHPKRLEVLVILSCQRFSL
jgi:hypothetical protein